MSPILKRGLDYLVAEPKPGEELKGNFRCELTTGAILYSPIMSAGRLTDE